MTALRHSPPENATTGATLHAADHDLMPRELHLPTAGLDRYKSASQRAASGTESWGAANFFCPACESPHYGCHRKHRRDPITSVLFVILPIS